MESFKERVQELKNSAEFKRSMYVRRVRAISILVFGFIFLILGYLVSKHFGISRYSTSLVSGCIAFALSIIYAEIKANNKFKGRS